MYQPQMNHCNVILGRVLNTLYVALCNGCDAVRTVHCHWSKLRYKQTRVSTGGGLLETFLWHKWTYTLHTHLHTHRSMRKSVLFWSGKATLAVFHSECVFVSLCGPHGPDSSSKETGLSPRERWMGWEISVRGVKGRREGKEGRREGGVCLDMQPLWADGQWHPKHFLPRTPSKGTCC